MTNFEMLCELLPADVNWGDPITPQMIDEIVMAEREECAKLCEKHYDEPQIMRVTGIQENPFSGAALDCAALIRLRDDSK